MIMPGKALRSFTSEIQKTTICFIFNPYYPYAAHFTQIDHNK